MISTQEASRIVSSTARSFGTESVDINHAVGRILAEDIRADRPFPPYNRVCMDGIAIDFQAFQDGRRKFEVQAVQAAGSPQLTLSSSDKAIEVMTGAVLPAGTTTVIRYEDLEKTQDSAFEILIDVRNGANIHYTGEDLENEAVMLRSGALMRSAEVALCATVGRQHLKVRALPRVAVISSGDELVEINQTPKPHQIRKSNVHMLRAELTCSGIDADLFHLEDDAEVIEQELREIMEKYDVLMMSGGVSKGKFDFIPGVLEKLGVKKKFHKVNQRPGKPFWFGTRDEVCVFAFPGNPVSTLVGYLKYFKPWLDKCLGLEGEMLYVRLSADFEFRPSLTCFAQASLKETPEGAMAEIKKGHGSGDMVNLAQVDGFVELPADKTEFRSGEAYPFIRM